MLTSYHLLFLTFIIIIIIISIFIPVNSSYFRNRFDTVADLLEPLTDGCENRCFISKSYDATSHFETAANDILNLYKRITGSNVLIYVRTGIIL